MPDSSTHYVIRVKHLRWLALVTLVALAAVLAITRVGADNSYTLLANTGDGRINVVHHFGGDALYCVDGNFNPINRLPSDRKGGFQLLNIRGERLWFVPVRMVLAKVAEAQPGGDGVLVAAGQGSYGPVSIYVYKQADGTVRFIFTGIDEHGKSNQLDFQGCQPVNPPSSTTLCTLSEVNSTLINSNVGGFLGCYERACPDVSFRNLQAARTCFCSQYPTSLICQRLD